MKALLYLVENKSSDVFYKQVFMLNNLRYSLGVHRIEQGRVNVSSIIVIQLSRNRNIKMERTGFQVPAVQSKVICNKCLTLHLKSFSRVICRVCTQVHEIL